MMKCLAGGDEVNKVDNVNKVNKVMREYKGNYIIHFGICYIIDCCGDLQNTIKDPNRYAVQGSDTTMIAHSRFFVWTMKTAVIKMI